MKGEPMTETKEQYRLEDLTPGQQIPEAVYKYFLDIATPDRVPSATIWRAYKRHGVLTGGGFLAGILQRTENGRDLYPAFGTHGDGPERKYYYLGLSGRALYSWRACIRTWPETEEERAARYRKIDELRAEGCTESDLADYYDMHPCYDPTGRGYCAECGAVMKESEAAREVYGWESPDAYREGLDADPEDPET